MRCTKRGQAPTASQLIYRTKSDRKLRKKAKKKRSIQDRQSCTQRRLMALFRLSITPIIFQVKAHGQSQNTTNIRLPIHQASNKVNIINR